MRDLDKVDILILQRLLDDGRASFSQLARETKLTDVAIKKRFERLRRQGIIQSVKADLNLDALGFGKPIFILLKTDPGKNKQIVKRLTDLEPILEFHELLGEHAFMVKAVCPDMNHTKRFLDELGYVDGIKELHSLPVVVEKKLHSLPALPFQKRF
ncbi:MAG: Lrp/AsnC family transcriptional regulator [Candidatus Diapherotrites archaeon]|nr:Lrp/AsnC family transcriptional regulator [Candidatus Diapherotrites archaeon]MDZ4256601.1 Lrp/AsnC family transcriptional regulator [archaeon]